MGADRQLVDWADVVRYYQRVDAAESPYVQGLRARPVHRRPPVSGCRHRDAGDSGQDSTYYADIQARLADPRKHPAADAERLIEQGKSVVLITCSIHSTEVASTLTAMEFLHDLVTKDTPRHRAILQETIFLLVPSLNPDGVDKVASWYRRFVGTPYEGAPIVELYQKYVGHDNNRDWYMFTQQETRLAVEKIHNVWRPQIVYDVHQMGSTGARLFVPPWDDPIDPNIDPLIVQQVNAMGAAMAVDLTAAGRKGVVFNGIYDFFTPARHYQSYHGGLRLLTESASVQVRLAHQRAVLVAADQGAGLQRAEAELELFGAVAGWPLEPARHRRRPVDCVRVLPLQRGAQAARPAAQLLPSGPAGRGDRQAGGLHTAPTAARPQRDDATARDARAGLGRDSDATP